MTFHDINQGNHFVYYHLMHALMSTCDIMLFKISSIGIGAHTWMTFELHIWVILGFPFLVWKPFFGAHLMGFRKLGLILVLPFIRFLCTFLGLD